MFARAGKQARVAREKGSPGSEAGHSDGRPALRRSEGGGGASPQASVSPAGRGLMMTIYLDYWLAYRLRFLALRARWTKAGPATGDWPAACGQVAAGAQVSSRDRLRAQIFATRIWYRCALASGALLLVNGFLGLAFPKGHQRDTVVGIALAWILAGTISMFQVAALSWRLGWTRRHVLRADKGWDTPAYLLRRGQPRRRDFWLMLLIAVVVIAGILWLSAHPNG